MICKERSQGKINFIGLLMVLLVAYGALVGYRLMSARMTKGQLKSTIMEKFRYIRGPQFTEEKAVSLIEEAMIENGLIPKEEIEGEEDGEDEEEGEETKAPPTAAKKADKIPREKIDVEIDKQSANIKFYVKYHVRLDLLFFKPIMSFTIQEEMLNYN